MNVQLTKRFAKRLEGRFGKYDFEVGVLEDRPYREPMDVGPGPTGNNAIGTYAGGPVRKATRKASGKTVSEVSAANRERLGFNYLAKPFQDGSADVVKFTNEFFRLAFGRSEKKRAENLLQAVVRNPIRAGEYGTNSPLTKIIKGFDRPMIDTAQLFKALKARCTVRGGGK